MGTLLRLSDQLRFLAWAAQPVMQLSDGRRRKDFIEFGFRLLKSPPKLLLASGKRG